MKFEKLNAKIIVNEEVKMQIKEGIPTPLHTDMGGGSYKLDATDFIPGDVSTSLKSN